MPAGLLQVLRDELKRGPERAWFVGGTIRDRLLERPSPDVDVVVEGEPRSFAERLARRADLPWFPLSHEFAAYRVVGPEGYLDVAGLRGGSLEADLGLRDFTINAMAVPVEGGDLVDPFGGKRHLEEGMLVPVGPDVFRQDPLRLMRAVRFLHVLGFRVSPATEDLIQRESWRLPEAAVERVLSEVVLTLEAGRSGAAICTWGRLGLLGRVFPELATLADSGRERYLHTLRTLDELDRLIERPGALFGRAWELIEERLAEPVDGQVSRPVALRLAGILHESEGIEACTRMRCSRALTQLVATVQANWPAVCHLGSETARPRDRVSFLWRTAPWEVEVLMVAAAHGLAEAGEKAVVSTKTGATACTTGATRAAGELVQLWWRRTAEGVHPLPVDGRDLMRELGLEPGPLLGEILWETRLAWESGEVAQRGEALAHARAYLNLRTRSPAGR